MGGLKMQDLKIKDHKNRTRKWRTSVIVVNYHNREMF